jgi:hypothetical protein
MDAVFQRCFNVAVDGAHLQGASLLAQRDVADHSIGFDVRYVHDER